MSVRKLAVISFVLAIGFAGPVSAADERTQDAVETRQGLLKVVRSYFGPIVGMARKQIPFDAAVIEKNAAAVADLLPMIPDVFRMDTRGAEIETGALDGIWEDWDDFAAKAALSAEKAEALEAAAADGADDPGAVMKAFGALGASCKGCHDEYRQQD